MINLSEIIQSAHGGQAIDTLSARFGLSPEQTQSAIDAMMPALQLGLQNKLSGGGGLGALIGHLGNGANTAAYHDPAATQASAATSQGGAILGDLFGGGHQTTQVAQQVSTESGVPASIIQAMLPVIASMLIGGLMHGAQGGGFGGILSGVLGSFLGQSGANTAPVGNPPTAPDPSSEGGLGGMLGSVLGGLFGGAGQTAGAGAPPPATPPDSSGGLLDEISSMITSGAPASPSHTSALEGILGR